MTLPFHDARAAALALNGDVIDDDQQPDEFAVPRPPLRQGLRKGPRALASLPDWNDSEHVATAWRRPVQMRGSVPNEQCRRLGSRHRRLLDLAQSSTPRFGFLVHGRSPGSADVPSSRDTPYPPQQLASRVFNVDEWGDPLAAFEQIACLGPDEPEGPLGRHSALSGDARRGCPSDER